MRAIYVRGEKELGRFESLGTDTDSLFLDAGENVLSVDKSGFSGQFHFFLAVEGHVAGPLLDLSDGLKIRRAVEGVAALGEELAQVRGDAATSDVGALDHVWLDEALDDRDNVGDTVTRVEDQAVGFTFSHKRKECLGLEVAAAEPELLEDEMQKLLFVFLRVLGCLCDKNAAVA